MSKLDTIYEEGEPGPASNAGEEQINHNEDHVAAESETDRRLDAYTSPALLIQNEPPSTYQVPHNIDSEHNYARPMSPNRSQSSEHLHLPRPTVQPNESAIFVFKPSASENSSGNAEACTQSNNDISKLLTTTVPKELSQNPPSTAAQCDTTSNNVEEVEQEHNEGEENNSKPKRRRRGRHLRVKDKATQTPARRTVEAACSPIRSTINKIKYEEPEPAVPIDKLSPEDEIPQHLDAQHPNHIFNPDDPANPTEHNSSTGNEESQGPAYLGNYSNDRLIPREINIIEYEDAEPAVSIDQLSYPEDETPQHLDAQHPNQIFNPDDPANPTEHNSSTENEEYQGPAYLGNHSNDRWLPSAINIIEYEEYEPRVPLDQLAYSGVIPLYLDARYPDQAFYRDDPQNDISTAHLCSTEFEKYLEQASLGEQPNVRKILSSKNIFQYEEPQTAVPIDNLSQFEGEIPEHLDARNPIETFSSDVPANDIITHLPERIRSTKNQPTEGTEFDENYTEAMNSSLPSLCDPPVSEEIDPTETHSRVVVMDNGVISFLLKEDFRVDITVDGAIRIQSKTNIFIALSANGKRAALVHDKGTMLQCDSKVASIVYDKFGNHKHAKMSSKGVSFMAGNSSVTYLLDLGGLRTTFDSFSDLNNDVSLDVFYSDSTHGPGIINKALSQFSSMVYWTDENKSQNWLINNVRISQNMDGFVRAGRNGNDYILHLSPDNERAFVGTPFLYCTASRNHFFVRQDQQRVYYDGVFTVKNGGQSATFDQYDLIKLL